MFQLFRPSHRPQGWRVTTTLLSLSLEVFSNFNNERNRAIPATSWSRTFPQTILMRSKRFCSLSLFSTRCHVQCEDFLHTILFNTDGTSNRQPSEGSLKSSKERYIPGQVSHQKPDRASCIPSRPSLFLFLFSPSSFFAHEIMSSPRGREKVATRKIFFNKRIK